MYRLESVAVLTAGTEAQNVAVNGLAFMIENNSAETTVYFKEKRYDGEDATSENGYALAAGRSTPVPVTAMELSVAAAAGGADVRVLILDEI